MLVNEHAADLGEGRSCTPLPNRNPSTGQTGSSTEQESLSQTLKPEESMYSHTVKVQ